MIDDLDRDSAVLGFIEGTGYVAVMRFPCFRIYLRLQCGLECAVRITGPEEIGVAPKKLSSL
jgi:hypothetical protein